MSGYFDMLPTELLDDILGYLHFMQMVPLTQCNSHLRARIEPEVYRTKMARDNAMLWAIRYNHTPLICRLVEQHGASPSFLGNTVHYSDSASHSPVSGRSLWRSPKLIICEMVKWMPDIVGALRTIQRIGSRLDPSCCPLSQADVEDASVTVGGLSPIIKDLTQKLIRTIASLPVSTYSEERGKLALVRYYYDTLREQARHLGIGYVNNLQDLPRLIRSDQDFSVVKLILDREGEDQQRREEEGLEKKEEKDKKKKKLNESEIEIEGESEENGEETNRTHRGFRLVDRPVKCGPHGALISPLSAAVLCNAKEIFALLLERGANIHGPKLDFQNHGPTVHALHIPMFAAAHVLGRRKTHQFGADWIQICVDAGANINHMALCKLSGTFKVFRPRYAGTYMHGSPYANAQVYFWATPIDVFVDSLSMSHLKHKTAGASYDSVYGRLPLSSIDSLYTLSTNGALTDLGAKRTPPTPRPRRRRNAIDKNREDRPITQNGGGLSVPVEGAADKDKGTDTDAGTDNLAVDTWRDLLRVRSPVTIEVFLDRITVARLVYPMARGYADVLVGRLDSGSGHAARLLSKYDAPLPRDGPVCPTGATDTGRSILTKMLMNDAKHADLNIELLRYIVYIERRSHLRFIGSAIANLKLILSKVLWKLDINATFEPCIEDDEQERTCQIEDGHHISNHRQARPRIQGWTALHELCRLWNHSIAAFDQSPAGRAYRTGHPRFIDHTSATLELLTLLISHGLDVHSKAENGQSPIDVLTNDADALQESRKDHLQRLAAFMRAIADASALRKEVLKPKRR